MVDKSKDFRVDINGLRAWAVIAVILFHFGVIGFAGGFVGVDIFFVISGFLMTGIIVRSLEKEAMGSGARFSVLGFWLARGRRIVPALTGLCLFLMIVGWFFLTPTDYKRLGQQSIAALGFVSNFLYWMQAGYFDTASHEKLLLHTWSLSVEWQFYIVLPILLLIGWKLRPTRAFLAILIGLGALVSFGLSALTTPWASGAAFFLLPARAWELLAGGLVAIHGGAFALSAGQKRLVEGLGFLLIAVSIFYFDSTTIWPGWRAAVPVVGAMLVLVASRQDSLWTRPWVAQRLGDWSYSLYLWHWPFASALVFLRLEGQAGPIAVGLVLTVVCGWLSYRFIETPSRIGLARLPQWGDAAALAGAVALVALPSVWIARYAGIPERVSSAINAIEREAGNKNPRARECLGAFPTKECAYGGGTPGVIVFGDSHAGAVVRSVERSLPDRSLAVLDWTTPGCQTVRGLRVSNLRGNLCADFVEAALRRSDELAPDIPMLMVNRYATLFQGPNEADLAGELKKPSKYLTKPHSVRDEALYREMRDGVIATACRFAQHRPVYILRPIPEMGLNVPVVMSRSLMLGRQESVSVPFDAYLARNTYILETLDLAAARCGVKILDPAPLICRQGTCRGDVDGVPIYVDDDHLSEHGADLLIPLFRQMFSPNVR
ncbi:acyltransferase family protein [Xanthobacter sp. KR7-225]|uniref:acyltransferase family protein n=1 Tax=Xanthobacter sp. KR7-225 TaxID=3156613 RepID=UPI0032B5F1FD